MKKGKRKSGNKDDVFEITPVDDHMSLPIGTDFDYVIKAKAEEIDSQK